MSTRQKLPPRVPIQSSDECQLNLTHVPWNPQIDSIQTSRRSFGPTIALQTIPDFTDLKEGTSELPKSISPETFCFIKIHWCSFEGGESNSTISEFLAHGSAESKPAPNAKKRGVGKRKGGPDCWKGN